MDLENLSKESFVYRKYFGITRFKLINEIVKELKSDCYMKYDYMNKNTSNTENMIIQVMIKVTVIYMYKRILSESVSCGYI